MVRFGDGISDDLVTRSQSAAQVLRQASIPGVTDVVGAYSTVLVCYDPLVLGYPEACALVAACLDDGATLRPRQPRTFEIPVLYGGSCGPDLDDLAAHAGMTAEEVIETHARPSYRICMIGFLPGFPYLSGLDERIACPRLAAPRKQVPAGSVGIAENQTGMYPVASPGGWRLIGRTPLKLFDPASSQPVAYQAGDFLRFVPIAEAEYRELAAHPRAPRPPEPREARG